MWRTLLDWMGLSGRSNHEPDEGGEARVAALLNDRARRHASVVGEYVMLDLTDVRARIGDKWPRVSRHVHLLVENVLSRRLRGNSTFFRCAEGVFAIVFADKSREDAERECGEIAREIMGYLFGEAFAGLEGMKEEEVGVHSGVFEIGVEELQLAPSPFEAIREHVMTQATARALDAVQAQSVDGALAHVERSLEALVAKSVEGSAPKLVQQLETLVSKLRALERSLYAARPIEAGGLQAHAGEGGWVPIEAPTDPLTRLSALIERTERALAAARATERTVSAASGEDSEEDDVQWLSLPEHKIDFLIDYLPILDITAGVKGIYLARLKFRIGGCAYTSAELKEMENDEEVFAIADRLALRHLVQSRQDEGTETASSVIVMTLHQTTLVNLVSRRHYIELATQLSQERRRTLFFEIVLGPDWRSSSLSSWMGQLKPYCRGFFLRFPAGALPHPGDFSGVDFAATRIKAGGAIGIDLADPDIAGEEMRFQALRRIAAAAHEVPLRTYALNVDDARDITLCRAAAIRYLSSEPAMPPLPQPGGIVAMSVDEIAGMNAMKTAAQR